MTISRVLDEIDRLEIIDHERRTQAQIDRILFLKAAVFDVIIEWMRSEPGTDWLDEEVSID